MIRIYDMIPSQKCPRGRVAVINDCPGFQVLGRTADSPPVTHEAIPLSSSSVNDAAHRSSGAAVAAKFCILECFQHAAPGKFRACT